MLKLYSVKKENVVYSFLAGKKYTVGRKTADITLPDDQSISRHHADLEVDHPRANYDNPSLLPTLMVTDLGSKFGTYLNNAIDDTPGIGINMREPVSLVSGDRIRFGKQWSEFKVEYTPLVVTGSTLKDTKELKDIVGRLGGHMVPEWIPQCQFVAMDSVTLTIKAVCALLSGKYIVSPAYFKDLLANAETNKQATLDPMDYTPPFVEQSFPATVNFQPLPSRSKLFKNKTFIFYTNKQMKKLGLAIQCGSGDVKLLSECTPRELESSNTLMLQPPVAADLLDDKTAKAIDTYSATGKRFIQESEISLAAVHVSIAKHCNPYFSMNKIFAPLPSQSQREGSVIIPETQSTAETQLSHVGDDTRNVIEESFNLTDKSRSSDVSHTSSSSSTRVKVENSANNSTKSQPPNPNSKRTHEETMDSSSATTSNPKRRLEHETETPEFAEPSGPCPKKPKSSTSTKTESILKKSKVLSAFFDSDSDEDDDIIPASIDPESQSQTRAPAQPTVPADYDFVGIKRKELRSPNKGASTSSKKSNVNHPAAADDDDLEVVPGTPEMSDDDENDRFEGLVYSNTTNKTSVSKNTKGKTTSKVIIDVSDDDDDETDASRRPTEDRSILPTMAIPTMALPTMPLEQPSTSTGQRATRSKKLVQGTLPFVKVEPGSQSSQKRKTTADMDDEQSTASSKRDGATKKLKTTDVSKKLQELDIIDDFEDVKHRPKLDISECMKPAPAVTCDSLIRTDRPPFRPNLTQQSNNNNSSSISRVNGSSSAPVPNFKMFRKIWPLTPSNSTVMQGESTSMTNFVPRRLLATVATPAVPRLENMEENQRARVDRRQEEEAEEQEQVERVDIVPESDSDDEFFSGRRTTTRRGRAKEQKKTRGRRQNDDAGAPSRQRTNNRENDSPVAFDSHNNDEDPSEGLFDFD